VSIIITNSVISSKDRAIPYIVFQSLHSHSSRIITLSTCRITFKYIAVERRLTEDEEERTSFIQQELGSTLAKETAESVLASLTGHP